MSDPPVDAGDPGDPVVKPARPRRKSPGSYGGSQGGCSCSESAIQCANCGGHGHVYRICNHPISSFGVICVSFKTGEPRYLLVQRKDSLCYVEFVRGKYSLQNRGYIMKLLSNMTAEERTRLREREFDDLWYGFWQTDSTRSYMKEYEQSKSRFDALRRGYFLRPPPATPTPTPTPSPPPSTPCCCTLGTLGTELVPFSLDKALEATTSPYTETEYGFPKGRRNINESDVRCACREFSEETGVLTSDIDVMYGVKPFEEVFTGSNKVRYRHVYYMATPLKDLFTLPELDEVQRREIRSVGWYTFAEVMDRIRAEHVERKELFRRVHAWVLRSF